MSYTDEYFYDRDTKKCVILDKKCIFVADGEEPDCDVCRLPEEAEEADCNGNFEEWRAEVIKNELP
jgi:hypothetical protein